MRGRAEPAFAGDTHVGLVRTGNEDAFLLAPPLFAVADGLGGHQAGEIASSLAIDRLLVTAPRIADARALGRAIEQANAAVIEAAETGRGRSGMGTTLTAAMLDGSRVVVAHVGDSRAYLLHYGRLQQLTEDHSMVADLVRQGALTAEEARFHPNRSVITRALGSDPRTPVDILEVEATPGDRLLLATDGLTGLVPDAEIERILALSPTPGEAVDALIDAALEAGGADNVTVVVSDVEHALRPRRAGAPWWGLRALWVVAAFAIVLAAAALTHSYARSQAYLIAEDGRVALYQGVPGSFAGVSLSWRSEVSTVTVDLLDPLTASRLATGIRVEGIDNARALLDAYRVTAAAAATSTATP